MSELTPSFCGDPGEIGVSRWSLECAISRRPEPSATIDGRLSLTASVKPNTPGPCHWAPSKYTISPIQIEPTLSPPVEWLDDIPVPLGAVEIHHLADPDRAHAHPARRMAGRHPRAHYRAEGQVHGAVRIRRQARKAVPRPGGRTHAIVRPPLGGERRIGLHEIRRAS